MMSFCCFGQWESLGYWYCDSVSSSGIRAFAETPNACGCRCRGDVGIPKQGEDIKEVSAREEDEKGV